MRVALSNKDKAVVQAFIDYAADTEGMRFVASSAGDKRWTARAANGTDYEPVVVNALVRNFKADFGV